MSNNTFLTPGGAAFHMRGIEIPNGESHPPPAASNIPPPPPPPPPVESSEAALTPLPFSNDMYGYDNNNNNNNNNYNGDGGGEVPRMVVMSKLADAEKERYFEFLLENNIQFDKIDNNYYVANVKIVVPEEGEDDPTRNSANERSRQKQRNRTRALATGNSVKIFGRRASRPPQEMARVVSAIATARQLFDYSCYPKFSSLVTLRDTLRPRRRHYAWLMKMIEEIYDDRYDHDTADLRNAENGNSDSKVPEEHTDRLSNIFPVFVVDFLSKRFGLRSLVDQHAWDLLYNVHALRATHLEVELFARFLEEYYDPDDLLFFLYVRSVVQKELVVNFVNRWTSASRGRERIPKPILLTYRECQIVARIVFGSEQDPLYGSFMAMIDRHVRGRKLGKNDSRRIEVYQFLHVALVGYHETRPAEDEEEIAAAEGIEASMITGGDFSAGQVLVGSKDEQERLFIEAERDYEQRMSKLADAQLAADGKNEQDMDREMRVQEMEDAINRAMDARRAAQRSGEFKSTEQFQVENENLQAEDLAIAHAKAQQEANYQRAALETSKRAALEAEINAQQRLGDATGSSAGTKMDMNGLDQYLDTINKDRLAIEEMELSLRQPNTTSSNSAVALSSSSNNMANSMAVIVQQLSNDLAVPMSITQSRYLQVLMESCEQLPMQVVSEIKSEIEALLTAKITEKMNYVTGTYRTNTNVSPMPLTTEEPTDDQLVHGYASLVAMMMENGLNAGVTNERKASMEQFSKCVVTSSDVRQEIEPMVALLVTYAQARLTESEQ